MSRGLGVSWEMRKGAQAWLKSPTAKLFGVPDKPGKGVFFTPVRLTCSWNSGSANRTRADKRRGLASATDPVTSELLIASNLKEVEEAAQFVAAPNARGVIKEPLGKHGLGNTPVSLTGLSPNELPVRSLVPGPIWGRAVAKASFRLARSGAIAWAERELNRL